MNKKDLIAPPNSSDFVKQLFKDINRQNKIDKNANLFILANKLQKFELRKNFANEELPIETHLGTIYLIKNNSILEFYTYCTNSYQNDISSKTMEQYSYFNYKPDPYWMCTVTVHNMNRSDIGDFVNADMFTDMDELTSADIDRSLNFMIMLIKSGFSIYVKK